MQKEQEKPVWFITGCSTGLGREIAKMALAQGYRTVVTARDSSKIQDIVATQGGRALALQLDVNRSEQVAEAVAKAEQQFGAIDVLVNNAGYGYLGAVEEGEDDEIRALFETNFFAVVAMTQAVLPWIRGGAGAEPS